jgi:long-chain acyl-CoA synthetase
MLNATLAAATHAFAPSFDAELAMEVIEELGVTHSVMVPTMINRLVHHPSAPDYDLSSLELLLYGGSPMAEAVIARAEEVLPGVRMLQAYGQTETSPVLTVLKPEYHVFDGPFAGKTRSAGQVIAGTDLVVMDTEGRILDSGEAGEVCARGRTSCWATGTARNNRVSAMAGSYQLAATSTKGFLFITDRVKDMIAPAVRTYSIRWKRTLPA